MNVSIVIARRDPQPDEWRQRIADHCEQRARHCWPDVEYVVGDSDNIVFNHAAAFNAGARAATGDVLVLMDADTTVTEGTMAAALRQLEHAPWVMAQEYWKLTEGATSGLLDGSIDSYRGPRVDSVEGSEWIGSGCSWAGFVVIRRADFMFMRGYDERLSGWAPDDIAFGLTADALVGLHHRVLGSVFHLWHPPTFERDHGWTDAKHEVKNAYLAAAGDPEKIRAVMEGKPWP